MGGTRDHRRQPHQHGTLAGRTASIRSSVRSSPSWDEQSKTRCLRLEESPLVQRISFSGSAILHRKVARCPQILDCEFDFDFVRLRVEPCLKYGMQRISLGAIGVDVKASVIAVLNNSRRDHGTLKPIPELSSLNRRSVEIHSSAVAGVRGVISTL